MAGRDCPWARCSFCAWTTLYPRFRVRSPENVLDEIEYLVEEHGAREIFDDTGTLPGGKWLRRFCEGLIERDLSKVILFSCNMRFDYLKKDLVTLMKKAGCHMIKFGVESGVQSILNRVKKGITIEKTREVFKWAHEIGIDTHAHTMLGMPGDTKETIKTTINFVKKIDPTTATFGICTPYAGTPLFNEVISKDPSVKDGSTLSKIQLHVEAYYNKC